MMVFTFLSAVAEFELESIKERVRSGLEQARNDGTVLGRPAKDIDIAAMQARIADGESLRFTTYFTISNLGRKEGLASQNRFR
jgi:DNA invertase Pin-like site-specific DNA recombinase